jgi:hypothetical protein
MRREALFIVLLALVAVASADIQITSYSILPTTLKPGVTGSATITVYNPSTTTATGVVIYQGGEQFTFTSNRVQLGDLGPLGSTVITIPFIINNDTTPGVYNLRLDAFWTEGSNSLTKTLSIPISVTNPPIFSFSFTALKQVVPSEHFAVEGQITNNGGSVSRVVLTTDSSYFFLDGISQLSIGNIASGQNVSFNIPLVTSASATPGVQSIPLVVTYQDPQGAEQETTITINPVNVEQSSVDFIVNARPGTQPVPPGDMTV